MANLRYRQQWNILSSLCNVAHVFSDLNHFWIFWTDLYGSPQYPISQESVHRKPGSHMPSEGQTEGHEANRRFSRLFELV